MALVIDLADYRARRNAVGVATARLDDAVGRLDSLVSRAKGRLQLTVERELVAIANAVAAGRPREATALAERLADRLEHPAALG